MRWSLASLLAAVILLRILAFLALHIWSMSAGQQGFSPVMLGAGDDGRYYYSTALSIANGNPPLAVSSIYPVLLGGLVGLAGIEDVFWLKLLNVIAGCAVVFVGIRFYAALVRSYAGDAHGISNSRALSILILLVGLYPSAIWNSSASLYRDAWLFLLHLSGVYTTFMFVQCRKPSDKTRYGALSAVLIVVLCAFRWYAALSLLLGLLVWLGLRLRTRVERARSGLVSVIAVVVLITLIFVGARTLGFMPGVEKLDKLTAYRSGDTAAGSSLGINLMRAPIPMVLPLYAYSFVSNLIGPLPWQINSMSTLCGFLIEGPLLLMLSWGMWKRRRYLDENAWYLLCQAIVWLALIAFSNDNVGTALRLRVIGWQCLFVVYAYLLHKAPAREPRKMRGVRGTRPATGARV